MNRVVKSAFFASVTAASVVIGAGQSFAIEPGDFQATLRGVTIGIPLGAAPPPGLYGSFLTFSGINDKGVGQNSAAAGANLGNGLTVYGQALIPTLVWSTGYNILGANLTFAVIKPFFTVAGLQTNCGATCNGTPPIAFGNGSFFENVHNTIWASSLSWNLGGGWFTSAGLNLQGPDGSQYQGTLNQDYWTWSPTFAIAYLSKDWHLSMNAAYDIHTASKGRTGTYAAILQAGGALPGGINPGNGYTSGHQLFVDWAAKYNWGKWQFGPVGYFKWQTTSDSPGGGYTCASLTAALGASLSCGRANDIALGAMVGINLGAANFEVYATDSISTTDDFKGWSIFTRLSFQIYGAEPPAPKKGLITKAK